MTIGRRRAGGETSGVRAPVLASSIHREAILALEARLVTRLIGRKHLVHRMIIALLADGHVLLDGRPGLAKTRATTALADALEASFRRVVLGPGQHLAHLFGLEPALSETTGAEARAPGPLFANILLAEGIDRASPEVRLALLDAMSERQVTVSAIPVRMPAVFLVCATRTLVTPSSDAVVLASDERDRFLLHLVVGYPDELHERQMLDLVRSERAAASIGLATVAPPTVPLAVVLAARASVQAVRVGPRVLRLITTLVAATRDSNPARNGPQRWIRSGAGPRGSIALERCARAHAWLAGRQQVTERDVAAVAHDVLRHRIDLAEAAEEAGVTIDKVIDELLASTRA
ncbi:AAA family ATPase [Falsiroseomonas sp. E2-1-a20]|uniref:AAA family ATPase n=1 Tax=Falsiroseomonas sp. E2-1-a20 TaxID=3239300 RepID=UPI003F3872E7